jgi:hypothetical protein
MSSSLPPLQQLFEVLQQTIDVIIKPSAWDLSDPFVQKERGAPDSSDNRHMSDSFDSTGSDQQRQPPSQHQQQLYYQLLSRLYAELRFRHVAIENDDAVIIIPTLIGDTMTALVATTSEEQNHSLFRAAFKSNPQKLTVSFEISFPALGFIGGHLVKNDDDLSMRLMVDRLVAYDLLTAHRTELHTLANSAGFRFLGVSHVPLESMGRTAL